MSGDIGQVIGVVKDFHFFSYCRPIGIAVIHNHLYNHPSSRKILLLEIAAGNSKQLLEAVQSVWERFFPGEPFEYTFMDEDLAQMYKPDIKTSQLIRMFSVVAIFICCLGLLGMISFIAEQKTKEIGIRKVLGASSVAITTLLSKDFIRMILIALLIASPVAWWVANKWLEEFVYRIEISWWEFATAGLLVSVIAMLTISFQAIKAAMVNPVESLRNE